MFKALARVIVGFILACIAAGLAKVLFVVTPVELVSVPSSTFPQKATDLAVLAMLTATHTAIFSATFALVATGIAEWLSLRSPLFYVTTGIAIALLGFFAQYSSEVGGQPTIFNSYALAAYITAGLIAGLVYWALAGRKAGVAAREAAPQPAPASRPRIIVEKSPVETGAVRKGWASKLKGAPRDGAAGGNVSAVEAAEETIAAGPADNKVRADTPAKGSVPVTKPPAAARADDPAPSND